MAGAMGHGGGSASVEGAPGSGAVTRPPTPSQGGKGTSSSMASPNVPPPPPMRGMGRPSGQGSDWFGTLMQQLAQRQSQPSAASMMQAPSYAQMTNQALNGKAWGDLTPKPPTPAPTPAEPAAAAPSAIADLQSQIEAMRQQNASHYDQFGAPYDPGRYAAGRARGGSVDDDDIVKLALNLLRRKFQ